MGDADIINHSCYADDLCLISLSPAGMKTPLYIFM